MRRKSGEPSRLLKTAIYFHASSNCNHDVGLSPIVFSNMDASETNLPYPAQTKQTAGLVDGIPTNVMVVSFGDKIMVTVTQAGRLAQWVKALRVLSLDATDRHPRSTCLYLTTNRRIQIHT